MKSFSSAVAAMALPATVLKVKSESKLNLTARAQTNITDHRLTEQSERSTSGPRCVRLSWLYHVSRAERVKTAAETNCRQRQIQARTRNIKVRVIEDIENLSSEFQVRGL